MPKYNNLVGERFNRLTVLERADDHFEPSGRKRIMWKCLCDCGNITILPTSRLKNTLSCGCAIIEANKKRKKEKPTIQKETKIKNKYDLNGQFGIGYTSKKEEFWFDLEDFDKIKKYGWYYSRGYLVATSNYKKIFFHNIVMDFIPSENAGFVVDHIIHPRIGENKYDNRKSNLRIVTYSQNMFNRTKNKNNTSGVSGVSYNKKTNKWLVRITVNKKRIYIGSYKDFEDAMLARKDAENKYYDKYKYKSCNEEE